MDASCITDPPAMFRPDVFAERMAECRRAAGFTLDTLSERTGLARSKLSHIEGGYSTNPTLLTVTTVAEALGVSPLYLLGWDLASIFGRSLRRAV